MTNGLAMQLRQLAKEMTQGDPKTAGMLVIAAKEMERLWELRTPRPEEPVISAGGMQELKLYGTPGYVGTVGPAFTVHVDPDVPAHTIIVRDGYGRELRRIINIGGSSAPQTRKE